MGDDNNDGTKCSFTEQLIMTVHMQIWTTTYSVIHISIPPIKELCSKMAPGEVGVSLP